MTVNESESSQNRLRPEKPAARLLTNLLRVPLLIHELRDVSIVLGGSLERGSLERDDLNRIYRYNFT